MASILSFMIDALRSTFRGSILYFAWMAGLSGLILLGLWSYLQQWEHGLIVTGMSDQISWGIYIANFAYLVGIAAAAVMLIIPAYIFGREDIRQVVVIGEGVAMAAVTMAMMFVLVDLGQPIRFWHMIPFLGRLHFPQSMLAWDVLVLSGYLALNILIPTYILYCHYMGRSPVWKLYFSAVVVSIVWAISIHTVTAFLFSSNVSRPFWNTAILGPRFIASAFCSGPALIILALEFIDWTTTFKVPPAIINTLALITTASLQITMFLLGVEIFTDFYFHNEHALSAEFLFFGLYGNNALVPWIWSSIGLNLVAVTILTIHPLRRNWKFMNVALGLLIVGVWIDKGMGLIVPGFVPTPMGEVFGYEPTLNEIQVSIGIWAFGFLLFSFAAKVLIAVEDGSISHPSAGPPPHGPYRPGPFDQDFAERT